MNNTNITLSFQEKIERANKDFSLFDSCGKILVGLSGGADSTSLLLALKQLSPKYGFEVLALHVNHMIRGKEADRDEEFARQLCLQNGIEFICVKADVPALSQKSGESLELCARNVRYKAFEEICKQKGISRVATAHNACDNAETVIFNLVRGTGAKGLCGIPPKRILCDGITVIRPLIYTERCEIEDYLSSMNQNFVTDSTNEDTDYTRNYIRNVIIPSLKKINPSLEQALNRTSRLLDDDDKYLSSLADKAVDNDVEKLRVLHKSILSRVVIKLFSQVSDETLSEYHVNNICSMIYSYDGKKNKLSLPDCKTCVIHKGRITFEDDVRKSDVIDFNVEIVDGLMLFEENPYALYISFDQTKDIPQILEKTENIYKKYTTDYLYFDTIPHVLFARNRHDGDRIFTCGMNKSVKRLMLDSDYNERERYLVPFVCTDDKILLIPGVAKSDECKKGEGKDNSISISLYRKID